MAIFAPACSGNASPFGLKVNYGRGCTFDKINSGADLLHSTTIPTSVVNPTKTIAIWCDITYVEVQVQ